MPEVVVDVDSLYAALDAKREAQRLSWRDLASQLDISPSTFTRMSQGRRPDVDAFATLLRWLGRQTDDFTRARPQRPSNRPPVAAMVSLHFRAARNVRDEDVAAYEDIVDAAMRRLERLKAK
jgi:transcriptional regulator with XRE-family HTH domain